MFYMNILYVIGCKNIHTVLLKLYNQFYMNIQYEIVRKNVHTFMKKNIWTPHVFNFFYFFERILHKSNCIIFIFSWCGTHKKIRSKLVLIVTAGSQKITLWGPQRTSLGILRVNEGSNRLGYDTVITSKCDVVCVGKIVVNYWRFMTCTPHHTSFEYSDQEDRDEQGM